jgi:hypothetical protein
MRTRSKLLFASVTVALLLSMAVGSVSARDLSITNRAFRIVWTDLRLSNHSGQLFISCPVTLEGSFRSATIHKVEELLIGYMTRGTVVGGACTGGRATVNQEALPWHIRYGGFSGRLPTITLITMNIIVTKYEVESAGLTCKVQTPVATPLRINAAIGEGGGMTEIIVEETLIPLRTSFFCAIIGEGFFAGRGRVTLLGNTTTISIRLI